MLGGHTNPPHKRAMTLSQVITLAVLVAVIAALIWDRVRADVVALTGAAVLLLTGVVRPVEIVREVCERRRGRPCKQ